MTPVSLLDLRASIVTAVQNVTPTLHADEKWAEIKAAPEGPQKRRFTLGFDEETEALVTSEGEGVIGGGNTWEVDMLLECSYSGDWPERDELIIQRDRLDLWHALRDGAITGIVNIFAPVWQEDEDAEDGEVRGEFIFLVRYFANDGSA